MPILFRCRSCRGKLSISRRKVATVIQCPKCKHTQLVPSVSEMEEELTEMLTAARNHQSAERESQSESSSTLRSYQSLEELPLFEKPEFEKLLEPPSVTAEDQIPAPIIAERKVPQKSKPIVFAGNAADDAVVLSRSSATLAMVLIVLLISLSFIAGYFVGRV